MNLNNVQIIGRLTRDPELKTLPSGRMVATFSLATSERFKNRDGRMIDETEYHNIVVYGSSAEPSAQYLRKGKLAFVMGKLKTRDWEKDGVKHYRTEIIAKEVLFGPIDDRYEPKKTTPENTDIDNPADDITPEDIPF